MTEEEKLAEKLNIKEESKEEVKNQAKDENEIGYTFTIGGKEIDGIIAALSEAPAKYSLKYMMFFADMKKNSYEKYKAAVKEGKIDAEGKEIK